MNARGVKRIRILVEIFFLQLISWVHIPFRQIFNRTSGTSVRGTMLNLDEKNYFNFYSINIDYLFRFQSSARSGLLWACRHVCFVSRFLFWAGQLAFFAAPLAA